MNASCDTEIFRSNTCLLACCLPGAAQAERIKDLASVQGVRANQLVGYGLVVGLDGTGDQTTQTPFTVQSIANMLSADGYDPAAGHQLAAQERGCGDGDGQSACFCPAWSDTSM